MKVSKAAIIWIDYHKTHSKKIRFDPMDQGKQPPLIHPHQFSTDDQGKSPVIDILFHCQRFLHA